MYIFQQEVAFSGLRIIYLYKETNVCYYTEISRSLASKIFENSDKINADDLPKEYIFIHKGKYEVVK
jgi:hypothetical protein